jgi:apolipoprotein N-acyltransferase
MSEAPGIALRAAGPLAPLQRLALWTAGLSGWRRHVTALALGALAAGALSPVDLTPLLLIAFSGLVWLFDGSDDRRDAALLGWSFGFGFFLAGLYWIAAALFVDIAAFWWLLPFAVLAVPAGLAIFTALAVLAAHEATRRFGLLGTARILVLALAWAIAEWLRGHVLTGFPWNLVGYGWAGAFPGSLAMLQVTSLIGIYGLSLLTVTAAALPARLGDLGGGRLGALLAAFLLIAAPAAGGAWRLGHASRDVVPDIMLRLVQPSIAETLMNDEQARARNFQRLLSLSAAPGRDKVTDIIWPEAAAPPLLERYADARRAIAAIIPKRGLLLTGVERGEPVQGRPERVWNSVVAIDAQGDIIATYDKAHLVPFGEYVPLRGVLPMDKIAPSVGDLSEGPGPRTLDLPGLPPVSPLICYEVIFPGAAIDPNARPAWLLTVTNDAWYGVTSGPFQHVAIARVRAVEEGLPLIRAANNGISAVVDPYGRVLQHLDLNAVDVLDSPLPRALSPTFYEHARDMSFWVLALSFLAVTAILSLGDGRRGRRR